MTRKRSGAETRKHTRCRQRNSGWLRSICLDRARSRPQPRSAAAFSVEIAVEAPASAGTPRERSRRTTPAGKELHRQTARQKQPWRWPRTTRVHGWHTKVEYTSHQRLQDPQKSTRDRDAKTAFGRSPTSLPLRIPLRLKRRVSRLLAVPSVKQRVNLQRSDAAVNSCRAARIISTPCRGRNAMRGAMHVGGWAAGLWRAFPVQSTAFPQRVPRQPRSGHGNRVHPAEP